ncbi:MAG: helix-turn-helix domain-containing protein [Enterococcus sp.]
MSISKETSEMWTIELARRKAGFTQEEIAEKLNMSRNSYRKYEMGEVIFRADKAWEFSKIVKIPFGNIIFFETNYTLSVVPNKEGKEVS